MTSMGGVSGAQSWEFRTRAACDSGGGGGGGEAPPEPHPPRTGEAAPPFPHPQRTGNPLSLASTLGSQPREVHPSPPTFLSSCAPAPGLKEPGAQVLLSASLYLCLEASFAFPKFLPFPASARQKRER